VAGNTNFGHPVLLIAIQRFETVANISRQRPRFVQKSHKTCYNLRMQDQPINAAMLSETLTTSIVELEHLLAKLKRQTALPTIMW